MDKLKNYNGHTELGSGLRPMGENDFALAEAHHIQTREDGTRLDVELDEIKQSISNGGGGGGGTSYNIGNGLKLDESTNTISVDVANKAEQDNTKPITSSAVNTIVGNINVLLETI